MANDTDLIGVPVLFLDVTEAEEPVYSGFNQAALDLLKLDPKAILGRTSPEVLPAGLGVLAYSRQLEVIRTRAPASFDHPASIDGKEHQLRALLKPEIGANGKVARICVTVIDVTADRSLHDLEERSRAAQKEMEQFVNLAAHDLRTPMRHVHQIADMLREDFEDLGDGKLQLIGLLEGIAEKAMRLIHDVLTHARTSDAVPEFGTFDLQAQVETLLEVLDPLQVHSVETEPLQLTCDRTAMTIVLRNLMDNAFKHADGRHIALRIGLGPGVSGEIAMVVEDNGPGFSAGALANINKGQAQSGGFGLLGIYKLIAARGGRIHAGNRPDGKGSRVVFSLPGRAIPAESQSLRRSA